MPIRNSPSQIRNLDDLSQLSNIVSDKRRGQRSLAKKSRRNRHYEKQFIRNTVMRAPINPSEEQIDS
jgi:ribosomal protein L15E